VRVLNVCCCTVARNLKLRVVILISVKLLVCDERVWLIFSPVWWQAVLWYGDKRKVNRCFEYNIKIVISLMCRLWFFTSYLCTWRPEHITRFLSHRHNLVYIQCWKVENIEQKYVFGILNRNCFGRWYRVFFDHVSVVHSVVGGWVLFVQHWYMCRNIITHKWSPHCMSAEIYNDLVQLTALTRFVVVLSIFYFYSC